MNYIKENKVNTKILALASAVALALGISSINIWAEDVTAPATEEMTQTTDNAANQEPVQVIIADEVPIMDDAQKECVPREEKDDDGNESDNDHDKDNDKKQSDDDGEEEDHDEHDDKEHHSNKGDDVKHDERKSDLPYCDEEKSDDVKEDADKSPDKSIEQAAQDQTKPAE